MVKTTRLDEDVLQTGYSNDERKGIQLAGLLCIAVGVLEVGEQLQHVAMALLNLIFEQLIIGAITFSYAPTVAGAWWAGNDHYCTCRI